MFYVNIDGVDYPSNNLPPNSNNEATIKRRERRKRSKSMCAVTTTNNLTNTTSTSWFQLAPLPVAVPQSTSPTWWDKYAEQKYAELKQEGKTPMRYNDNYASASANVTTVQSDAAVQRDYLLNRLARLDYPKEMELVRLYNLYVDNSPKTYKELIDAIKNDKFTIDKKVQKRLEVAEENGDMNDWIFCGMTSGIIWSGLQPDRDGFDAASKEKEKRYTAAKDIIMTSDAVAGLKALQDFEAWLPTPAVTITTTSVN